MKQYEAEESSFNVMIVMTDGQDSSYNTQALEELRKVCLEKGVILYTIGMGDVSTKYLENLADSGMGSFVYCNNSTQLADLYSFIHNQVDNNYVLSYRVTDTETLEKRVFTISTESEEYYAVRAYSVDSWKAEKENSRDNTENTEESKKTEILEDANELQKLQEEKLNQTYVTKLGISTIIKSKMSIPIIQTFSVLGFGFNEADSISISLRGQRIYAGLKYSINTPTELVVELPKNIEYGTYEVLVNVDGMTYVLKSLTIKKPASKT